VLPSIKTVVSLSLLSRYRICAIARHCRSITSLETLTFTPLPEFAPFYFRRYGLVVIF